ncbi:MAG: lipase family protein [Actinomycetes bacterium]
MSGSVQPNDRFGCLRSIGVAAIVLIVLAALVFSTALFVHSREKNNAAAALDPFYEITMPIPVTPGAIIRSEPLGYSVPGGTGYRIVYTSIDAQGKPVAVSGRIFIPTAPVPSGGRKVLAYAHGTVGLAPQCAPSRNSTNTESEWLDPALQAGWVVTATDFLGLGVEGPATYLIADQEARDVVNSVRAAQQFAQSLVGKEWVVWGSSAGGHAALSTASRAAALAPELHLVGVGAAAPAAELAEIFGQQWNTAVGWAVGPYGYASWSTNYPKLNLAPAVSEYGMRNLDTLLSRCVVEGAIVGVVQDQLGRSFLSSDPNHDAAWSAVIAEQTPSPPPAGMAMFLAQGTADTVVLASSNALLNNQWCEAGVRLQTLWLGGVVHQNAVLAGGPAFIAWATDRFTGKPAPSTCGQPVPAPVVPLAPVHPAT